MTRLVALLSRPGSTRHLAIFRIGLVCAAWSEWAGSRQLFKLEGGPDLLLSLVFFVSSAFALVGCFARSAMLGLGATSLALVYGQGLYGEVEGYWHHHDLLLAHALVLASLVPCGHSFSVDRWLADRRAERQGKPPPTGHADLWATRVICIAEASVWFWGGVDKLEPGFLRGDRMLQIIFGFYPPLTAYVEFVYPVIVAASIATVFLELALPFGLWFRRFRPWLLPAAILLHAAFYVLLPVATFSVTMVVLLLAWPDPDEVDAVWSRLER